MPSLRMMSIIKEFCFRLYPQICILIFVSVSVCFEVAEAAAINCNPNLQCMTCNITSNGTTYCTSCPDGFASVSTFPYACEACGSNCAKCSLGRPCTQCNPMYGPRVSPPYDCSPCIANCISCQTNVTYCDTCVYGYYLYQNNLTCGFCAANCSPFECQVNGAGKCDRCDLGYGLTPTNTCTPCAPNCNNSVGCNTSGTCIKCNPGFGITPTQTCAPCDPYCNNSIGCNTSGTCIKCNQGYGLTPNQTCGAAQQSTTTRTSTRPGALSFELASPTNTMNGISNPKSTTNPACDQICENSSGCLVPEACNKNTPKSDLYPDQNCSAWVLELGLIIGIPCAVVILLLLVCIFVLCAKNRKLKKQLERCKTSVEMNASNTTKMLHQPTSNAPQNAKEDRRYQALEDDRKSERPYEPIEHYDTLRSNSGGTIYSSNYERPVNPPQNTNVDRRQKVLEDDRRSEKTYEPVEQYDTLQSNSRGTIYSSNTYDLASPVPAMMNGTIRSN